MKKIIVLFFVVAMLMMATSAMAVPITGEINFVGNLTLIGGSTLLEADGIDFNSAAAIETTSGIYDSIPDWTPVTFADLFYFNALPVTPLWTLTYNNVTYRFDLTSITSITDKWIIGTGVLGALGGTDYDNTVGTWQLTTQDGRNKMSFSASSKPVPEPGTLLLLGTGLVSLTVYARRRKNI